MRRGYAKKVKEEEPKTERKKGTARRDAGDKGRKFTTGYDGDMGDPKLLPGDLDLLGALPLCEQSKKDGRKSSLTSMHPRDEAAVSTPGADVVRKKRDERDTPGSTSRASLRAKAASCGPLGA